MADLAWWQTTLSTALGAIAGGAVTITIQVLADRRGRRERWQVRQELTELELLDELRDAALSMLSAASNLRAIQGLRERLIDQGEEGAEEQIPAEVTLQYAQTNARFREAQRRLVDSSLRTAAEEFLGRVVSMLLSTGPGMEWMGTSIQAQKSMEQAISKRYLELHGVKEGR